VYAKFQDGAGQVSEVYSDEIILDTAAPLVTLLEYPPDTVTGNSARIEVVFSWQGSDASPVTSTSGATSTSGSLLYQYRLEGYPSYENWSEWSSQRTATVLLPSGRYTFKVRAKDEGGNYPAEDDKETARCSFTVALPVIVYPNPCYLDEGRVVTFANLPLVSEVKIYLYDLAGNLIRTLDENEMSTQGGSKACTWNLRNNYGDLVTRDIYIYLVHTPAQKKTGKVAVVR